MSSVLITGGAGYVGGRVASHLRGLGHLVIIGTRNHNRASGPGCILTDFEDQSSLLRACKAVDAILHLAGMNEIEAAKNPEAALYTTATYTLRLVQAARASGVKRFLYFSTVHVYGSPLQGCLTEDSPTRAGHAYSIAHRAAEDFVYQAHNESSLTATIFRLSNSYGYPESPSVDRWSLLVNDLCRQVATTGQISLKSSGHQYRDFIPLCDVCGAVAHFLALPRASDPVFNLGSGVSLTVRDVANRIAQRYEAVTNGHAVLTAPAARPGGIPLPFSLSVERLKAAGFAPRSLVDDEIDELIRKCILWHKGGVF